VNFYFFGAALLITLLGLAHSVLGEWLLLGPLFRRGDVPKLIGSRRFAKRTLRFAWHLTTVLMWCTAAILIAAADPAAHQPLLRVTRILAAVYLVAEERQDGERVSPLLDNHGVRFSQIGDAHLSCHIPCNSNECLSYG